MQTEHFPLQVVDGDTVNLTVEEVRRAAGVVPPEPESIGSAILNGIYYNPVALASEATHVAERRLSRRAVIFALQQLQIPIFGVDPAPISIQTDTRQPIRFSSRLLEDLKNVPGEWVAVRGEDIIHAAKSLRLLLEQLEDTNVSVFKAPTKDELTT